MNEARRAEDGGPSFEGSWPVWLLVRDESTLVAIFHDTQEGRRDTAALLSRLLIASKRARDRAAAQTPGNGPERGSRVWVERVDLNSDDPWGEDSSPTSRRLASGEQDAPAELGVPRKLLDFVDRWTEPLPPQSRLDLVTVVGNGLRCDCGCTWTPPAMTVAAIWDSTRQHLFTDCPLQRRYEQRHRWARFRLACPACSHPIRWHYPDNRLPGAPVLCGEPTGQGNTCACDGTGSRTINLFDRAALLMGTQVAADWFTGSNDYLDGARPIDILRTSGPARIDVALDAHQQK